MTRQPAAQAFHRRPRQNGTQTSEPCLDPNSSRTCSYLGDRWRYTPRQTVADLVTAGPRPRHAVVAMRRSQRRAALGDETKNCASVVVKGTARACTPAVVVTVRLNSRVLPRCSCARTSPTRSSLGQRVGASSRDAYSCRRHRRSSAQSHIFVARPSLKGD